MAEQIKNYTYFLENWGEKSPEERRPWRIALAACLGLWLLGSLLAATQIAAIVAMERGARLVLSAVIGPMGLIWSGLELTGAIVENVYDPGPGWMVPFFLQVGWMLGLGWLAFQPASRQKLLEREMKKHRRQQGQLEGPQAAEMLAIRRGIPFVEVQDENEKLVEVGLDYFGGQGHVIVIAPTQSGKGLHLTDVLASWPGAAVVVDPKSEQYARTAALRRRYMGPVYHLPGVGINLSRYYDFLNPDDIQELHDQLLRPGEDLQRIFADKSLPLFQAVGHFAREHGLDPMRVLLDAAEDDLQKVLVGLDSVSAARPFVRQFTNGQPPGSVAGSDRFLTSAYGTFTTRLFPYQKHINTICPVGSRELLPADWVDTRGTVYITYNLSELHGVGGVVAAILAGLMREHQASGGRKRLLVAIDEMAAVRLRRLDTYLATVAGAGITMLLYSQSMSQIEEIYGSAGAQTILNNCDHQLWYPPNDHKSAVYISDQYGTSLKPSRSYSTVNRTVRQENGQMQTVPQQSVSESLVERRTFVPTEVSALPREQVFVFTRREQQLRFIGKRLDSRNVYGKLTALPQPPPAKDGPRRYTRWLLEPDAKNGEVQRGELLPGDGQPAGGVGGGAGSAGAMPDDGRDSADEAAQQGPSSTEDSGDDSDRPAIRNDNWLK